MASNPIARRSLASHFAAFRDKAASDRLQAGLAATEARLARGLMNLPEPILRRLAGPPITNREGATLDLHAQVVVRLSRIRRSEMGGEDLGPARRRFDHLATIFAPPAPAGVATRDEVVAHRPARVYTPPGAHREGLPGLVYLHGGGFVFGTLDTHDAICRSLCSRAQVVVVSIDYRLAPEHPLPAGLEDATLALDEVLADRARFGIGARAKVGIGGDSAGANLATGACLARRGHAHTADFQLLIYPSTDATRTAPSHAELGQGFVLTTDAMTECLHHYLAGDMRHARLVDPRMSPLHASDLRDLPPALVLTAGFDPLRDEGRAYASALAAAGVPTTHVEVADLIHGCMNLTGALPAARRALDGLGSSLGRALRD